jgi:histidyl-tRNA synthetase
MGQLIEPRTLKGFLDILPKQEFARRAILKKVEEVCQSFGFVPIDTPVMEYSEVLLGKGGGETDKQVFRFEDHGNRDVSLRFDLTVPFARFMAAHRSELYLPFKRYHFAKVFRGEKPQKGRYREFMQCDFDIVGSDSLLSDLEILQTMAVCFSSFGIDKLRFLISHRGIFSAFLEKEGIAESGVAILRTVDKLAKIGADKVKELLNEEIAADKVEKVLSFITKEDSNDATIQNLIDLCGEKNEHILRLETIIKELEKLMPQIDFVLDPSITRGLDYYTGIVYETYLQDLPSIGSVCSGGRYDNLTALYTKEPLPGVGSSIGLDRLVAALEELDLLPAAQNGASVIIFNIDDNLQSYYLDLANSLRKAGIQCEIFHANKKMNQQFKFAETKGHTFALICGEEEQKSASYTVKDLRKRENHSFTDLDSLIQFFHGQDL